MNRYAVIDSKLKREFVLLQGSGCRWKKCLFCDYHNDLSDNALSVNCEVLQKVTGVHGVLDVINSGSAMELDKGTIEILQQVVKERHIHTLWFEAHYMYRHKLAAFAKLFEPAVVKFRCGVETFNAALRNKWQKGIPENVKPEDIARYFKGVCLLCCTEGEDKEHIVEDIRIADSLFEYFSVNIFCNNTTSVKQDKELASWFVQNVYQQIKDNPKIEILLENTELGVG
jgi:hypothetical protein